MKLSPLSVSYVTRVEVDSVYTVSQNFPFVSFVFPRDPFIFPPLFFFLIPSTPRYLLMSPVMHFLMTFTKP